MVNIHGMEIEEPAVTLEELQKQVNNVRDINDFIYVVTGLVNELVFRHAKMLDPDIKVGLLDPELPKLDEE